MDAIADYKKVIELDNDSTFYSAFAKGLSGDITGGYKLMMEIINKSDDKSGEYYNMACLKSLTGKEVDALKYIDLALSNGYKDYNWLKKDDDFLYIKYKHGFKALLKKYNIPNNLKMDNLKFVLENELRIEVEKWEQKG
ncbi:MAG: hypothetical protein PF489_09260, partial [Salinivirgaceae bacterium]|nr:hypothetical protein [Salinivirgaceae bacterium]